MKKRHPLLWLIPLILLLLLIPFMVPSALPYAGAEETFRSTRPWNLQTRIRIPCFLCPVPKISSRRLMRQILPVM